MIIRQTYLHRNTLQEINTWPLLKVIFFYQFNCSLILLSGLELLFIYIAIKVGDHFKMNNTQMSEKPLIARKYLWKGDSIITRLSADVYL